MPDDASSSAWIQLRACKTGNMALDSPSYFPIPIGASGSAPPHRSGELVGRDLVLDQNYLLEVRGLYSGQKIIAISPEHNRSQKQPQLSFPTPLCQSSRA